MREWTWLLNMPVRANYSPPIVLSALCAYRGIIIQDDFFPKPKTEMTKRDQVY